MAILFDRECAVSIGGEYFASGKDTGFRISFDVTKTIKSAPLNKASIRIYNVSEDVFENILAQRRDVSVEIFAGYQALQRIFVGNPVKNGVEFVWSDADRILKISAQDGYKAYRKGRLALSLDADNITLQDVVAEASAALNLPIDIVDIPGDVSLGQGIHLQGPAPRVLDRIAAATGAEWSIQDGTLQFLPRRKVRRNRGPEYSSELRNIITYPRLTEEGIKLTVFLDSSLLPGDRFKISIDNARYDGIYKATTVKHTGDLWETPFYTEITARPWTAEVASDKGKEEIKRAFSGAEVSEDLRRADEERLKWWPEE